MRLQLWLAPILGLLLTVCDRGELSAQYAPMAAGGHTMSPGVSPSARQTATKRARNSRPARGTLLSAFTHNDPAPANNGFIANGYSSVTGGTVGANPYAPGMLPSPAISPFENRYDQTYNKDGIWKRLTNNDPRKYHFDVEWLHARLRRPSEVPIGARNISANTLDEGQSFTLQKANASDQSIIGGESVFPVDFKSEGIRGRWGFQNPDGSRFRIEGWWVPDVPTSFGTRHIRDDTTGTAIIASANGSDLVFDTSFHLSYQTEAFGSGVEYMFTPWKRGKHHAIRPVIGMKYLNIQEQFAVNASSTTGPTVLLENSTTSNLVGPEAGIAFEVGGDFIKIYGESKFGVMFNRERIGLSGTGFGLDANNNTIPFVEKRVVGHASPTYEGSLVAEIKLFSYMPVIRRYQIFDQAVVRIGGTYIAAYEIARPNDTVVYNTAPRVPTIRHRRTKWHAQWLNVGISWKY